MDHADFGKYLAQQRALRGLSLADVAKETKISESLLKALESGQTERLPTRIFVLNYVRAYALAVGLNAEDTVLRYEEIDKTVQTVPPPPALERARQRKAWVQLLVIVLVVAAAAAAFFWWNRPPIRLPH
ncbi:MAG: helix-turn-helix domain-containing protein [Myxococcaceae bacterium]